VRAVVQRVKSASVSVRGEVVASIGPGLLVLVAAGAGDGPEDIAYLADKVVALRVFPDDADKMNLSLADTGGEILAVSQFTLYGDCRKGRRPSFVDAMEPEGARAAFEEFVRLARGHGVQVLTGEFREMMDVALVNQGPVTLLLDSRKQF
jgi:D-tyrosyl-tRNA(Tyr) deacylase